MVNVQEVRKLAQRLAKAEELARDGAVFPVAGLDGYAVVRNGDGTQLYLVRYAAGHEHCTCPDFQHQQGNHGQPCKHILAAELAAAYGPQMPQDGPRALRAIEFLKGHREVTQSLERKRALASLDGEWDEVDRLEKELATRRRMAS